jgi:SsrA-binding protein
MADNHINIKNKKAKFEFHLEDEYVAGIQLTGSEIKSIRNSKASIMEAYCVFVNDELFVRNMHIAEYENASYYNHLPRRDRKLLLNKLELSKLFKKTQTKGNSIVPTHLFINANGLAKLRIYLASGKKLHDKREDMKQKDAKREMDRAMKSF